MLDVEILLFNNFTEKYSGVYVCERKMDGAVTTSKSISVSQKRKVSYLYVIGFLMEVWALPLESGLNLKYFGIFKTRNIC